MGLLERVKAIIKEVEQADVTILRLWVALAPLIRPWAATGAAGLVRVDTRQDRRESNLVFAYRADTHRRLALPGRLRSISRA